MPEGLTLRDTINCLVLLTTKLYRARKRPITVALEDIRILGLQPAIARFGVRQLAYDVVRRLDVNGD